MFVNSDELVILKINEQIRASYAYLTKNGGTPTVAEVLDYAQDRAEKSRKGPRDLTGRDVEYYLKGRANVAGASSKPMGWVIGGVGVAANAVYDVAKIGALAVRHPEWLESERGKPATPPGGNYWEARGIWDGNKEDGSAHAMPRLVPSSVGGSFGSGYLRDLKHYERALEEQTREYMKSAGRLLTW